MGNNRNRYVQSSCTHDMDGESGRRLSPGHTMVEPVGPACNVNGRGRNNSLSLVCFVASVGRDFCCCGFGRWRAGCYVHLPRHSRKKSRRDAT